jgi:hypothetical protein
MFPRASFLSLDWRALIIYKRRAGMFFEAIFQPSEKKGYSADAVNLIGKTIAIEDGWIIDEGDYKGQQCFYIPNSTVGWIPSSDLKNIQPVPFARWKEIHANIGFGV